MRRVFFTCPSQLTYRRPNIRVERGLDEDERREQQKLQAIGRSGKENSMLIVRKRLPGCQAASNEEKPWPLEWIMPFWTAYEKRKISMIHAINFDWNVTSCPQRMKARSVDKRCTTPLISLLKQKWTFVQERRSEQRGLHMMNYNINIIELFSFMSHQ